MAQRSSFICHLLLLALLLAGTPPGSNASTQTTPQTRQAAPTARIRWSGKPRVRRYRLQLARDKNFTDIVFDRAVFGLEYNVTELPSGVYYWRVAPAASETGTFSRATRVEVAPQIARAQPTQTPRMRPTPIVTPGDLTVRTRPTPRPTPTPTSRPTPMPTPLPSPATTVRVISAGDSGWRTATGEVAQPVAATLRSASSFDLVGVNSEGLVYALDGANGAALWTARFRPQAKRGEPTGNGGAPAFAPVIVKGGNGLSSVVAAFEGGVRGLDGATGRELWRVSLQGRAASGAAADLDGDGMPEIYIVEDGSPGISIINSETGKFIAQNRLEATVIGPPFPFIGKNERGLMLSLENGLIDLRNAAGERVRAVKLDTRPTTPPLVIEERQGALGLVGVDGNLIAINIAGMKPIGRIATEDDAPRGLLAGADLDGDGSHEVVMITRLGRTVVINGADGKIRWYATGATDASSAAFADVNNDGTLDVLVAAGTAFAIGFSGKNGALIWKADEDARGAAGGAAPSSMRGLVTAMNGRDAFLVGSDSARTGLRAVGLPQGSVRIATR